MHLDPDTEAIVTIGSKEGLAHLALATMGAGDTVLVPNPAYPDPSLRLHHRRGRRAPRAPDARTWTSSRSCAGPSHDSWPKPKMLVLNFPGNPTTQCVELDFFQKVIDIAGEHGIWVVHDLAYADIVFDGYKAPSILQVPGAKDIAVEFFSMSKSYNMPGWRVGFMCGNKDLVAALARIKSYLDYGTFTPIQVAAIAALEGPQDCVREISDMYQSRRDVLCKGLHEAGWEIAAAQGHHVRLGAHPGRHPGASSAPRSRRAARCRWSSPSACLQRGQGGGLPGDRLRRVRGRPCALRPDRERAPHPPGGARHQGDVPPRVAGRGLRPCQDLVAQMAHCRKLGQRLGSGSRCHQGR